VFQAADLILLPLRPSYFDMRSGYDVWSIVEDRPVRWVLNAGFADGETGAGVNEAVQSELNRTMASLKQSITHHPDWVMSASSGLSVFEYAPQSQASAQLQALWLEVNAYPVVAVKHRYG
jgi:cellulose biosynthesis protein BcsQ